MEKLCIKKTWKSYEIKIDMKLSFVRALGFLQIMRPLSLSTQWEIKDAYMAMVLNSHVHKQVECIIFFLLKAKVLGIRSFKLHQCTKKENKCTICVVVVIVYSKVFVAELGKSKLFRYMVTWCVVCGGWHMMFKITNLWWHCQLGAFGGTRSSWSIQWCNLKCLV